MQDYAYLSNVEGVDSDADTAMPGVLTALCDVGFSPLEIEHLLLVLSAVLHFSRIDFEAKVVV